MFHFTCRHSKVRPKRAEYLEIWTNKSALLYLDEVPRAVARVWQLQGQLPPGVREAVVGQDGPAGAGLSTKHQELFLGEILLAELQCWRGENMFVKEGSLHQAKYDILAQLHQILVSSRLSPGPSQQK